MITRIKDAAGERRLRLKHDHRHKDGSDDAITRYGGDSINSGTAQRQQFPVDGFSTALFAKSAWPAAAATNVWTIELQPGDTFAYEISRLAGRERGRVEFDLTKPVALPPAPWGDKD